MLRDTRRNSLLEPGMLTAQHFHCDFVDRRIVGAEQVIKVHLDPIARLKAERVRERYGFR